MKKKKNHSSFLSEMLPVSAEQTRLSRTEWKRKTQSVFHDIRRQLKKTDINGDSLLDLTTEMQNRRTEAILNTMEEIYSHYHDLEECASMPNILGEDWIWLNVPSSTYTSIEASSYILFAAAIWILDRIQDFDAKTAVCRLLTRDEKALDNIDSPVIWDCQHDEFLIVSVVHLLYERNSDLAPLEKNSEGLRKVLTNSVAASGRNDEDCESRARFHTLISMLPEADIEQAVSQFRELFWAWTDRYYRCLKPIVEELSIREAESAQLLLKHNRIKTAFDARIRKAESERKKPQAKKPAPVKGSPLMPVMPLPFPAQPIGSTPGSSIPIPIVSDEEREFREFARQFSEVSDELNEKTTQVQALLEKQNWLKHYMTFFGRPQRTTVEEDFGPEVAAEINDLEIRDPYALCFALLYLIEIGDDLPWLYGPGIGLMLEVAESLPWGVYEYEEEDDQIWFPDEDYVPGPVKPSAIPEWYERKYLYRKGKEDAFPRSLAQIVYEHTGCLMPRNMHLYDEAVKELNGYGIRGKDATGLLYCMLALANSRHQDRAFNLDDMMQRILDTDKSASEETETRLSYDELSVKADRQKEEIQTLRRALHEAERKTRAVNKELERLRAESQLEHRELADLRELVFLQNTQEEEPEEAELEGGFPYEVHNDTLVFGGHTTWRKAIKTMLTGNIRFLDKDKGFDSAIIRHTERVWIQTNALSHSQYYAIIDVIRQFKKPVRYFSYASAAKCAIQLRQADQDT